MLDMKPACEHCRGPLPLDAADALICSFECTFCAACAAAVYAGRCPNCGGELVARPRRPGAGCPTRQPVAHATRHGG